MRIRIRNYSADVIDGMSLAGYSVGLTYDVGTTLANYMLASGLAEPILDDHSAFVVPLDALSELRACANDRPPRRPKRLKPSRGKS
jgi:hypothetical protein